MNIIRMKIIELSHCYGIGTPSKGHEPGTASTCVPINKCTCCLKLNFSLNAGIFRINPSTSNFGGFITSLNCWGF